MLRVTVEEVKDDDPDGPGSLVGVAHIRNDGTGTESVANYDVYLSKLGKRLRSHQPWRHGTLYGFRRWQFTSWHLAAQALTFLTDLIGPIRKADTLKRRNGGTT